MSGNSKKGNKNERPSREQIFMDVARQFARRSTCLRKSVGAVLVRDNHILGTGFNGAARLQDECMGVGCLLVDNHCVRTVHAEVNAVLSAAYNGVSTRDSVLYTTAQPCFRCTAFLINAGVKLVIYDEPYTDEFNDREQAVLKIRRFDEHPAGA